MIQTHWMSPMDVDPRVWVVGWEVLSVSEKYFLIRTQSAHERLGHCVCNIAKFKS